MKPEDRAAWALGATIVAIYLYSWFVVEAVLRAWAR